MPPYRRQRARLAIPILGSLRDILLDQPNMTAEDLRAALTQRQINVSLGDVRTVLNGQSKTFVCDYDRTSTWSLTDGARKNAELNRAKRRPSGSPTLRPTAPAPTSLAPPVFKPPPAALPLRGKSATNYFLTGLAKAIHDCLEANPDLTAREIVQALARNGIHNERSTVNSELYRHLDKAFAKDASDCPRWSIVAVSDAALPRRQAPTPPPAVKDRTTTAGTAPRPMSLYAWQQQALYAWKTEGHRGIVEAVTGTGKTRVGMVAISDTLAGGGFVHVLVPSIDLQDQWCSELEQAFPNQRVGRRGNDRSDTFGRHKVIVSVVNSARDWQVGPLPPRSLLVADECHRYGANGNARALREEFERRLGLTATFARDDGGCESYLAPYFGDTCFRMGYAQAIQEEVTAHFKVALVGVDWDSDEERTEYERASKEGSSARKWLTSHGWAVEEPFGEFMKEVAQLADESPLRHGRGNEYTAVGQARDYLRSFAARRKLFADTASKTEALGELVPAVKAASRTIVFTETIATALAAEAMLSRHGVRCATIHSKMRKPERREILRGFAEGQLHAITAPRVLDEGIDVPAADLAIICATSKTRRQMVQRMGRVLRRKDDGRIARFIVMYVEGTTEDPASGAHESFIGEITDPTVAEEVRVFDSQSSWGEIIYFLNNFAVPAGQPPARMA